MCYPETFPTPFDAEEATCKKAINEIREKYFKNEPLKVTRDFDLTLQRVKEVIY